MNDLNVTSTGAVGAFQVSFEPVTHQDDFSDNRKLFFAKVSKTAGEDEIKRLFSEFGYVEDVIIFQSTQGSASSKGCGLVTMGSHAQAAAAIQGLHGKYAWSQGDPPMVVTWMDSALQDPNRQSGFNSGKVLAIAPGEVGRLAGLDLVQSVETPPAGCEPDAIKLFVGNLPLHTAEDELIEVFKQYGTVVELVIVRNKANNMSKGCAFVWFASRAQAEAAMQGLNLRHVLNDVTGQQTRPLVVRKARAGHLLLGRQPHPMLTTTAPAGIGLQDRGAGATAMAGSSLGSRLFAHQTSNHVSGVRAGLRLGSGSSILASAGASHSMQILGNQPAASTHGAYLGPAVFSAPTLLTNSAPGTMAQHSQHLKGYTVTLGPQPVMPNMGSSSLHQHQQQSRSLNTVTEAHMGLPSQGYVTTAAPVQNQLSGNMQSLLASGGHLQASQPYQLVVDMMPQPAAYNLQTVMGVGSDGVEQYLQVPAMQAVQQLSAVHSVPQVSAVNQDGTPSSTVVLALDAVQLAVVNDHLYTIQANTCAQLLISPGGPGTFNLHITGSPVQVDRAQLIVTSLISQHRS